MMKMNNTIKNAINDGVITTMDSGKYTVYTVHTNKCDDNTAKDIFKGIIQMAEESGNVMKFD